MNLDKLKVLIQALPPEHFDKLHGWMKMLKGSPGQVGAGSKALVVAETKADDFALHVLDSIVQHMDAQQADFTPRAALLRCQQFPKFAHDFNHGQLFEYFERAFKNNVVERRAFAQACVALLYEDLMSWHTTAVTSRTMMQSVGRIPAVLNKAFPGYAASGALHMILGQAKELDNVRRKRKSR